MNPRPSLLLFVLGLLGMVAARANPLPDVLEVSAYMASEDLTMTVGPGESQIDGRFTFRAVDGGWPKWTTTIFVPVLVPVEEGNSKVILARRWELGRFGKAEVLKRKLMEVARPSFVVRGRRVPDSAISARLILPSQRHRGLAKLFLGGDDKYACAAIDGRFAVIEFSFEAELGDVNRGISFEARYRQFHAVTAVTSTLPEARYVPFFVNLPKGVNPTKDPHYRLRFVAASGVQLTLLSKNTQLPHKGTDYLILPRDHEAVSFRVSPPRR